MGFLQSVAERINERAADYRMGEFQSLRSKLRRLLRIPTHRIFATQTINAKWAFHFGGRGELQFNIGLEGENDEWFRYGVAFSLEPSRSLPDVTVLYPKVRRLSHYIRRNSATLVNLSFWYFEGSERSPTLSVGPISKTLLRPNVFLFWGRLVPRQEVKVAEVLRLFDWLLPIYKYVEGGGARPRHAKVRRRAFRFRPGHKRRRSSTRAQIVGETRQMRLRHNELQMKLYEILVSEHGSENVGTEHPAGEGVAIDVVVREGDALEYFEIKTYPCVRACLREAVGQLLEYSSWPGTSRARSLVVVSENDLTDDARKYLSKLRTVYRIPVYHQRLDYVAGVLGPRE